MIVYDGTRVGDVYVLGPGDLAAITGDYQILLEHHRRDPDDQPTWDLLTQTRVRMETAWLQQAVA